MKSPGTKNFTSSSIAAAPIPFATPIDGANPAAATPFKSERIITESKALLSAFLASAALHAAAFAAVGVPWPVPSETADLEAPIKISFVSTPEKKAARRPPPIVQKDGSQLLTDPETGRVFNDYFAVIKARIQQAVLEKQAERPMAEGHVTLFFVLDSKGRLRESWVAEKLSTADSLGQHFALACLKEAAARFEPFPPALHFDRISFNVSLEFS